MVRLNHPLDSTSLARRLETVGRAAPAAHVPQTADTLMGVRYVLSAGMRLGSVEVSPDLTLTAADELPVAQRD